MDDDKLLLLTQSIDAGLALYKGATSTAAQLPDRSTLLALQEKIKGDTSKSKSLHA